MATVYANEGESIDSLLRRFKRKVESNGILADYRKTEYYVPPSEKRKIKSKEAQKRDRKRQQIAEKYYKPNDNFIFSKDKSTKIYNDPNKNRFVRPNNNHNQRQENASYTPRQNKHYQNETKYNNTPRNYYKKNNNNNQQKG